MQRPKVIVYVTTSLDGRISLCPNQTLSNMHEVNLAQHPGYEYLFGDWEKFDRAVKELYKPDAFMEGSHMVMYETQPVEPLPAYTGACDGLYEDYLPEEIVQRPGRTTWLVIVDGRGRLRSGYKGDERPEAHILHLTANGVDPAYLAFLQSRKIPYLVAGDKQVDLRVALAKMYDKLGVRTLALSSAGRLGGALVRLDAVDEINILFNPFIIGGTATPYLFRSEEVDPPAVLPARLFLVAKEFYANGSFWLRYRVLRDEKQ